MASTERPLKGILKKSATSLTKTKATLDPASTAATYSRRQRKEEDNAEIARKHAAILQQRRDLEAAIFEDIDQLSAFPLMRTPPYSTARPAPSDAAAFRRLVRTFQPGDYDDLIEERNTCGLCGYALCAKPRRTFSGGGAWKLSGRDIVAKGELEKWCSSACARRALYIKVQLNETAAWERVGIPDIEVELLEEEDASTAPSAPTAEAQLTRDLARLKLQEERRLAQGQEALALERGESSVLPSTDSTEAAAAAAESRLPPTVASVDVHIMEKPLLSAPKEPTLGGSTSDDAQMVEGHKIRFVRQ